MNTPFVGAPRTRTEYHVPDSATEWQYLVTAPERRYNHMLPEDPSSVLRLTSELMSYEAGGHYEQSWYRQPLAPAFDPEALVTRQGDVLEIPRAGLIDDDGNFTTVASDPHEHGIDSLFQIWHGDELLGEATQIPSGSLDLPPQSETYRFTYEVANNGLWARESTRTRTEWTFTSASTDPDTATPVSLLTLDYDLDLDMDNSVDRNVFGLNFIGLTVGDQNCDPVRLEHLAFSVSFDDGSSWRRALVLPIWDGTFQVLLPNRAPTDNSDFMSFQVDAEDRHGNTIEQEIIRAVAF
jgi:hypothetical protein